MSNSSADIQEQLQALRVSYAVKLPEKLDEIKTCWQQLDSGDWDFAQAEVLHRLTHSLAGSGKTFGFPELGDVSRSIERLLKDWIQQKHVPRQDQRENVASLLADLQRAANVSESQTVHQEGIAPVESYTAANREQPLIFLIEDDAMLTEELKLQLDHFGYRVKAFNTFEGVAQAFAEQAPDAFIIDINLPEGELAGTALGGEFLDRHRARPPVIFISSHNDFAARLSAVRTGGEAYFVKPLEVASLIDRLDQLTRPDIQKPYRILAVDDDESLAAHYALILRRAGMEVKTVSRVEDVMGTLADFKPELILMDVYMPVCSGLELSKLIRQQDAYLGIPIVFLSSETNLEKQYAAMRMGGDDFLTKPIQEQHLISSITVRAERARMLNSLMVKDSLTGLLKHTMIKEQLVQELFRAERTGSDLSFVMIDIDNFKQINDNHGHMVGDRVIKSLARLLQQRLRTCDRIGRYGGEEFAVVLPNCNPESAHKLIEEIRIDFSELHYLNQDEEFSVTFSAGIAGFPAHSSADVINRMADEALYKAKHAGRNCVVIDGN